MLLKGTGSRNNLPLRVQSPDEAPISKDKFGFSLETEEYDSIKPSNLSNKINFFVWLLSHSLTKAPQEAKK